MLQIFVRIETNTLVLCSREQKSLTSACEQFASKLTCFDFLRVLTKLDFVRFGKETNEQLFCKSGKISCGETSDFYNRLIGTKNGLRIE